MIDDILAHSTVIDFISENSRAEIFNLSIYPNSMQNELNIEFNLDNASFVELEITDIQERFIIIYRNSGNNLITTSISELNISKGLIIIQCKKDNVIISKKLMKIN